MKKFLVDLYNKLKGFFQSDEGRQALNDVLRLIPVALPYVDLLATILAGVTPIGADDAVLNFLHQNFPRFWDGSITDMDELKLYALQAGGALLQHRYPGVSTTIARSAVQLAVLQRKTQQP